MPTFESGSLFGLPLFSAAALETDCEKRERPRGQATATTINYGALLLLAPVHTSGMRHFAAASIIKLYSSSIYMYIERYIKYVYIFWQY